MKIFIYLLAILSSADLIGQPNMILKNGSVACKTLKTLQYAERIKKGEPVLDMHKIQVNNSCTTVHKNVNATAFFIGVYSKIEIFSLGRSVVFFVNTRDLINFKTTDEVN